MLSPGAFLVTICSCGNIRSMVSKFPPNDADSVLSVLIFPPTTLALVCSDLSSHICPPTTTITCAFASLPLPFAVACMVYIFGNVNVWFTDFPLLCFPSQKSQTISLMSHEVIAVNFVLKGALHDILSIVIYIPI
jgi:hypothetical protein